MRDHANAWLAKGGVVGLSCAGGKSELAIPAVWIRTGAAKLRPWSDMKYEGGRGKRHRKDLQLCRQVFDALTCALAKIVFLRVLAAAMREP